MVTAVHARGRGPRRPLAGQYNPIDDAETLHLWLIDFESAVQAGDEAEVQNYATRWGTPGFLHPARASRNELLPEDDLYAVAMILYSSVVPVNMLFSLNPNAEAVFLDKFIALGIPFEVKAVISSLSRGDVEEAQGILAHWNV